MGCPLYVVPFEMLLTLWMTEEGYFPSFPQNSNLPVHSSLSCSRSWTSIVSAAGEEGVCCQHRQWNTVLIIQYLAGLLGGCCPLLCCDQLSAELMPQETDWIAVCFPHPQVVHRTTLQATETRSSRLREWKAAPLSGAERLEIGWVFHMEGGEGIALGQSVHSGGPGSARWKPKT